MAQRCVSAVCCLVQVYASVKTGALTTSPDYSSSRGKVGTVVAIPAAEAEMAELQKQIAQLQQAVLSTLPKVSKIAPDAQPMTPSNGQSLELLEQTPQQSNKPAQMPSPNLHMAASPISADVNVTSAGIAVRKLRQENEKVREAIGWLKQASLTKAAKAARALTLLHNLRRSQAYLETLDKAQRSQIAHEHSMKSELRWKTLMLVCILGVAAVFCRCASMFTGVIPNRQQWHGAVKERISRGNIFLHRLARGLGLAHYKMEISELQVGNVLDITGVPTFVLAEVDGSQICNTEICENCNGNMIAYHTPLVLTVRRFQAPLKMSFMRKHLISEQPLASIEMPIHELLQIACHPHREYFRYDMTAVSGGTRPYMAFRAKEVGLYKPAQELTIED